MTPDDLDRWEQEMRDAAERIRIDGDEDHPGNWEGLSAWLQPGRPSLFGIDRNAPAYRFTAPPHRPWWRRALSWLRSKI